MKFKPTDHRQASRISGLVFAAGLVLLVPGTGLDPPKSLSADHDTGGQEDEHTFFVGNRDAATAFHIGEHYKRTGKVTAAEYYFAKIPQRWPESPWAVKAKAELAALLSSPLE